jgi:hypothetical protein
MKIMTVTNMWPISEHPYYGIFVKEQIEGLNKYYPELKNKVWFINGFKSKFNYILSCIQINWHLLFNNYDIIHVHFGLSGLFLLVNPFIKTPVVTMLHGSDIRTDSSSKLFTIISKLVVNRSNHVFYLNGRIQEILKDHVNKLEYLPCGINTNIFECRRVENKTDIVKIAFPASKQRLEKNYKFFSRIIDVLQQKYQIKIEVIEIHGKSRIEVCDILNSVDILVMTSISEGSPQIIKEAMCCNTPIVSSNVGDVSIMLKDLRNCYVINEFAEELFCKAIHDILKITSDKRFSNGRLRIFELGLDEESTSKKIYNAYNTLAL